MDIAFDDDRLRGARVEETDWGYTLHGTGDTVSARVGKGVSLAVGTAAIFACVGMWVIPGSTFSVELLPLKLTVSVFLFLLGCFFVQIGRAASRAEVQVDIVRREVRVMERADGEPGALIAIWPFVELGAVEVMGGRFRVTDRAGSTLADLRIGKRARRGTRQAAEAQPA